ncbi:MAG: dynamin family protein [Cyanomargarita calcarea GSE-NOS-MK-12-04C]|jgi:GTPase SAR1 family protein|uniref:Dynamin family protein n=1 Tax=Cyanomargarita calcarea GSE-NOS-MK-12-04C TaxID=2839659 RepID=A0A951QNZ3_9CYAN|nr:dynamin family protein [Cyanomargarita calcarea GSE-NOS-MK-12-04C]
MSNEIKGAAWLDDLDRVVNIRHQVASRLDAIAQTIIECELEGAKTSGKLGLEAEIERLATASQNLRQGVFRLLVLGDMKRGKSTFLNALLGQNLLPSDVSPCTALLTVLKYGTKEKVTIHYKDGTAEEIDFPQFKQRYTINPEEAKTLEKVNQPAFPDISHAVVEHPLPLLGKGIEFIDSPGLNDTEARNELSLSYIYNCNAILFVMSASQPCTLDERQYLQNYLKNRGLNIFFLINGWDRVRDSLINPEDIDELQAAEMKVSQVFRTNLSEYCQEQGQDIYYKRVFEISALNALRSRLKDSESNLAGTGFPQFLHTLNNFLTKERVAVEIDQALAIARQVHARFTAATQRRIPLLDENVEELQQKIDTVQSDFHQLSSIASKYQEEIRTISNKKATEIADSFKNYILKLEHTFEEDFINSQPELEFMQFFDQTNRELFYTSFKRAFERYINDRLAAWEFIARQEITATFEQLEEKADSYQIEYTKVVEVINQKLIGYRFYAIGHDYQKDRASTWADDVMNVFSSIPNSLNKGIGSFNMFWQSVFSCVVATVILQMVGVLFTGITFSVFGAIAAGFGLVALQAEFVRQQFLTATKKEFVKYLPQIAAEQWQPIHQSVKKCFEVYEQQISDRIKIDIKSRKAELDNLLQQKQVHEIDIQGETQRLIDLEKSLLSQLQEIQLQGFS